VTVLYSGCTFGYYPRFYCNLSNSSLAATEFFPLPIFGLATPPVISEIFIRYSIKDAPSIDALFLKLMSGSLFIALADMFVLNLDAYRGSGTSFLNYSTRTMRLFIFCDVCLLLRRLLFTV
jgi:hypothetical protein